MSRRYWEGTLVLETDFETAGGSARVIDFMPPRDGGAAPKRPALLPDFGRQRSAGGPGFPAAVRPDLTGNPVF